MTAMHLNSTDARGRALRARRGTTHVLRLVGDHAGNVGVGVIAAAVIAWMVNDVVEFTTVLNVTSGKVILLVLAAWGTARLIEAAAYDVADWIDPDSRDGDDLWDVAKQIDATTVDLLNGADLNDTTIALQASQVVPALRGLVQLLSVKYGENDEPEEAEALEETAVLLTRAANSLGHHDDDGE